MECENVHGVGLCCQCKIWGGDIRGEGGRWVRGIGMVFFRGDGE